MDNTNLIYKYERKLFLILFVLACAAWLAILIASKGGALVAVPIVFIVYCFGQSAFISHLRGTGALVSETQFPDIATAVQQCVQKLGMKKTPDTYILNGNGVFNAFATHFLRRNYVVLLSTVVDALESNPDAIRFYIGHELGHIRRHHMSWASFLAPASILPLIGAGYYRARESTCDLHGAFCCETPGSAPVALAVLAVGPRRWKEISLKSYILQTKETKGFWMSFHELISSYPWLTKRLARVTPNFPQKNLPRRNVLSYILAIFIPRLSVTSFVVLYALFLAVGVSAGQKALLQAAHGHPPAIQNMPLMIQPGH